MSNIYYDPEEFNLRILGEVDTGGSYEFDKVVVWQDLTTNELFYAQDAGCSCPTPFEDFDREGLIRLTRGPALDAFVSEVWGEYGRRLSRAVRAILEAA